MISVITSLTDITAQKLAESTQKRLALEAIEAKAQQENFIDVTSHEMRNPLSAIMISADDIIASLRPLVTQATDLQATLRSAMEAAQVIVDCAQHQRRIVDDSKCYHEGLGSQFSCASKCSSCNFSRRVKREQIL